MKNIVVELKSSLEIAGKIFDDDSSIKRFQSIEADFEQLVAKGYARKRGNNLLSISDVHLKPRIRINRSKH